MSVFCIQCGQANGEGDRYCTGCGAMLIPPRRAGEGETTFILTPGGDPGHETGTESYPSVDRLAKGTGLLVIRAGPGAGTRFLLDKDLVTAGRHRDADVLLDDVTVSRRHAEFHRDSHQAFSVRDVGSLNGTYVNRERIEHAWLSGGDEVRIGKFRLVFLVAETSHAGSSV